jgi:hypothetical protein
MTYSVRLADINEDKQTLKSLWIRNFGWITEGRYDWIYKNNPSGQPLSFLLHHDKSNSIVGAISLFPRKIFSGDEIIPAYVCGDLVIDQKHRALGPVLKLLKTVISEHENNKTGILISFAD